MSPSNNFFFSEGKNKGVQNGNRAEWTSNRSIIIRVRYNIERLRSGTLIY